MKRVILTACALWVAVLGIGCSPPEIKPTPDDISVLTTVLKDFLALGTASKLPILRTDLSIVPTLTTLLIDPTNLPSKSILADREMTDELSNAGRKLDASLARSLRKRNRAPVSLDALRYQCPDFKLVPYEPIRAELGAMQRVYPKANAFVRVTLPGYDKDGTSAVVQFWFGPSEHGSFAIYHLSKVGGLWRVDWHQIDRFL
jgi:hypothetical protein